MTRTYLGIDPGLDGALAFIGPNGATVEHMPVIGTGKRTLALTEVRSILLTWKPSVAIIERQGAMPGQGVVSMFSIGLNYGALIGLLVGLGIPYEIVTPQAWKKRMLEGGGKEKADSIKKSHALFPTISLRATERCRTDHDGMAEALLIAEDGRRRGI